MWSERDTDHPISHLLHRRHSAEGLLCSVSKHPDRPSTTSKLNAEEICRKPGSFPKKKIHWDILKNDTAGTSSRWPLSRIFDSSPTPSLQTASKTKPPRKRQAIPLRGVMKGVEGRGPRVGGLPPAHRAAAPAAGPLPHRPQRSGPERRCGCPALQAAQA